MVDPDCLSDNKRQGYKFIKTNNKDDLLIHEGFLYRKYRSWKGSSSYWTCATTTCKAKATMKANGWFSITKYSHNHKPNNEEIRKKIIISQLRRLSLETKLPPEQLLRLVGVVNDPGKRYRENIHYWRRRAKKKAERKLGAEPEPESEFEPEPEPEPEPESPAANEDTENFEYVENDPSRYYYKEGRFKLPQLVYNGYVFQRVRGRGRFSMKRLGEKMIQVHNWKCVLKTCKARGNIDPLGVLRLTNEHFHPPVEENAKCNEEEAKGNEEEPKSNEEEPKGNEEEAKGNEEEASNSEEMYKCHEEVVTIKEEICNEE